MARTGKPYSLDDLLLLQFRFMGMLGIDQSGGTLVETDVPSMVELGAAIGITVESAEILEAMEKANRLWKKSETSTCDQVKEELIDVLFFILELSVLLGLSGEDLTNLYKDKYNKNLERIRKAKEADL